MPDFLYISAESLPLAGRWLEEQPRDAEVVAVAEPGLTGAARALAAQYPAIRETVPAPDADAAGGEWEARLAAVDEPRIVLPLPVDAEFMEYRYPARLPLLTPHFPLVRRLWRAGFRRFAWHSLAGTRTLPLPHLLDAFAGCHAGRRCFVLGNGPSLNELDMPRLAGEITLGSNRVYLGFEQWGWAATYWGVSDRLQIEEYGPEYEAHIPRETVKFFPFDYWPWLRFDNACPLHLDWPRAANREFGHAPDRLSVGYTVTYMLLQAAAVMGCNPIILIGADHRYALTRRYPVRRLVRLAGRWAARRYDTRPWYRAGRAAAMELAKARRDAGRARPPRLWQAGDATAPTHFDNRYATGEKKHFLVPRPREAEQDFACARQWAEANGVQILNATPCPALHVFEKVDFDTLF